MTDLIVKIMLEALSVLALATKQIKQGRFSKNLIMYRLLVAQCAVEKFRKKLLGDSEVEAVLQRLDRMTQDEVRIAVAQTLSVVHGLVNNTKIVMEGAQPMLDWSLILLTAASVRWQGVDRYHKTDSGYVSRSKLSIVPTHFGL